MIKKVAFLLALSSSPALAQFYPTYNQRTWCFDWSCYPQQTTPKSTEPRRHLSKNTEPKRTKKSKEHRDSPVVHTKVVTVYRNPKTWHGLPQEDARDWINKQVQDFCKQYEKDEACHKKE
jgi:hypothetical protein